MGGTEGMEFKSHIVQITDFTDSTSWHKYD